MQNNVTIRLIIVLIGNTLLRVVGSSGGALIAFYLAHNAHQSVSTGLVGHGGAGVIGMLGVVLNLAELVGAVPVGYATDRFSARAVLVVGSLIGGIATLMFGLSQAIAVFFFARALQGLVAVVGGPPLLSLITEATKSLPHMRNRVIGFYELSLLSGVALGGLVGGLLWERFGPTAFSLLSVFYLVIAGLFAWGAQLPGAMHTERPLEALKNAITNPFLLILAPAWLSLNAIIGLWLTHVAFQLTGPKVAGQVLAGRFEPKQVGIVLLVYALLFAGGIVGWTFLLGRISRVLIMRISLIALLATCAGLFLLNAYDWPPAVEWAIVAITALTVIVESGFTPAALAYLAALADASEGRGSTMGIYTLLLGLGNAIGAGLGGLLAPSMSFNGLIVGTLIMVAIGLASVARLPENITPPVTKIIPQGVPAE